jgi:hypothetical protein
MKGELKMNACIICAPALSARLHYLRTKSSTNRKLVEMPPFGGLQASTGRVSENTCALTAVQSPAVLWQSRRRVVDRELTARSEP